MAEKENIYGIKYEVNIDELKTSTAEATKKIKLANAEFKESSSKLEDWGSSTDGVGAKLKQLNTILEANKSKLSNLKNEYNNNIDSIKKYDQQIADLQKQKETAIAQYGKESKEVNELNTQIAKLQREQNIAISSVDKLKISILNQQASINKNEKEIDKYNSKLNELQNENTQSASAMDKLKKSINEQEKELTDLKGEYTNVILEQGKTSAEAKKLASKIKELNSNLKANKSELNDAESKADKLADALQNTANKAKESDSGFTIMKGALADFTANVITSAIGKINEFISSLFSLSEATEEYRQMNAKIEGSAKSFGYSMDFAKERYKDFYGYLKDDQAATNAITNLLGLKTNTESLTKIAEGAIGVWASYGDSIPIESLTESINETIQVAKVTGTFADTLNWAKISGEQWADILGKGSKEQKIFAKAVEEGMTNEDAFNEVLAKTSSQQERANIVAQFLNKTYGESKKKYDELASGITEANRAELELKDSQAELGKSIEPVNTAINNLKAKALDFIAPAVDKFAKGILNLNDYLKDNPAAMKVVIAAAIGLATAFGILAGALAIQGIITGVTKAIELLNKTVAANPYVLIATAIAGLVAGFIYLWNTSEGFRNFWVGLWEGIKKTTESVVNTIITFFTKTIPETFNNFLTFISSLVEQVKNFFIELWTSIISFFTDTIPQWIDNVIQFFQKIPYYIGYMVGYIIGQFLQLGINLWNFATVTVPEFITQVIQWFSTLPARIWEWLVNAFNNVVSWGANLIAKAGEIGSNFINSVINFFKQLPSKVWEWLTNTVDKVIQFGSDLASKGLEAGKKLYDTVVDEVKKIPDKMIEIGGNLVSGLWEGITGGIEWLGDKIKGFGKGVLDGIKDVFDINSPSGETEWMGDMLIAGLGNSIVRGTKAVVKKAKNTASSVLAGMREKLKDKVTVGIDFVDDLKGRTASAVQSMYASAAGTRTALAGAGASNVSNVTFNQYNTSPKALDSLEVYRNTQKQINLFKKWKG